MESVISLGRGLRARAASVLRPLFTIAATAGIGGCGGGPAPATQPASPVYKAENDGLVREKARLASGHEHQKEVAALIEQATSLGSDEDRSAAALAAADRSTEDLARTIGAIDSAKNVVVTNLRNIDTTAFKSSTARIENGNSLSVKLNYEQGSLESTGRPLDVGIQGNGFFKVKVGDTIGDGIGYTRNGNFFVNEKGRLILGMGDGYPLIPEITIPQNTTEISISQSGKIEVIDNGGTTKRVVGQIKLTNFINAEGLDWMGGGLYTETVSSGPPVDNIPGNGGTGQLVQDFLETSNVDLVRERLRLRFLMEWRATLMRLVDGPTAAPVKGN